MSTMSEASEQASNAASATRPYLLLEGVSQSFPKAGGGRHVVLNDVSLRIDDIPEKGQVRSILGPSGCGKTTLFRIIAGLDTPESGRVLLTEELVPVRVGMVGVIFQSYPLFEHLTVFNNLVHPARAMGIPARQAREKARDLLAYFNLTEKADNYPVELSGGQRQRTAIAQQLMTDKHFLVMDEPFSGLDLVNGLKLVGMISQVANSDTRNTILIITHDVSMAIAVSDTVHLMGRTRDEAGAPKDGCGARIVKQYDLVERGLAYQPDIASLPAYHELRREIATEFPRL